MFMESSEWEDNVVTQILKAEASLRQAKFHLAQVPHEKGSLDEKITQAVLAVAKSIESDERFLEKLKDILNGE